MSAASYDSAHMGEGVEYHTVYGVSPWFTRTYLLPYRVFGYRYVVLYPEWSGGSQAGKSWFHGENHFVAFLIRRCMDVVRGLSRRLRSRDWLVLIHDGIGGSRSSGILCFCSGTNGN